MEPHLDEHTWYSPEYESSWLPIIAIVLAVIAIVLALLLYFYPRGTGGGGNIWTIVNYEPTSSNPIQGNSNTAIVIPSSVSNSNISISTPASPTGKMFLVDNTRGQGTCTVTASNATLVPSQVIIPASSSAFFLWVNASEIHALNTTY